MKVNFSLAVGLESTVQRGHELCCQYLFELQEESPPPNMKTDLGVVKYPHTKWKHGLGIYVLAYVCQLIRHNLNLAPYEEIAVSKTYEREHLYSGKKREGLLIHECRECDSWGKRRSGTIDRPAYSGWHLLLSMPRSSGMEIWKSVWRVSEVQGREVYPWESQSHERELVRNQFTVVHMWVQTVVQACSVIWIDVQSHK